jgi:CheY-like chemotaxis protein
VGIAPEDRERVFDDFVQIHAKPRHHSGGRGMGLGLAIVRRLAGLLGHRLELASRIGHGSRFSVCLPRASDDILVTAEPAPPAPATAASSLAGCRVAAIDDDPAVVAAMRALFETRGGFVAAGENADRVREALAQAGTRDVDLIVADLRLAEGVSGIDEVARLRAALGATIPALIVSGDTSEEARTEAAGAGLRLLAKPLVAATLEHAVAMLRRRRQQDTASRHDKPGPDQLPR